MKNQIAVELKYLLKKHGLTERFSLKKIMGNEITREESEFLIGLVLDDIVDFLNRPFLE